MMKINTAFKTSRAFALACGLGLGGCATSQMDMDVSAKTKPTTENGCKKIQSGMASWYGNEMAKGKKNGVRVFNKTASGEKFVPSNILVAHKTLPLRSVVKVKVEGTGREITAPVLDRGPYAHGRLVDLSEGAAKAVGIHGSGTAFVSLYKCNQ